MSFLGVMEAVRHRLTGGSKKSVPDISRLFGSWDGQVPGEVLGMEADAKVDAYLRRETKAYVSTLEVPVFWFDAGGQRFEAAYPSLTFDIISTSPRYDEFVYQTSEYVGDYYQHDVLTSFDTVMVDGVKLEGPRQAKRRAVEHPLDVLFEVRCYSRNPIVLALLESYIYEVFNPRDFIRVPMKDGSFRSWDVLQQGSVDLDQREAVRSGSPGVEREYAKSYTFKVEGYFDNTDTSYLVNLTQKRNFTLGIAERSSLGSE